MFDNFKVANYDRVLLSPDFYARLFSRAWTGDVIDGFTAIPGTGLQVILQPGNAFLRYGSANVATAYLVSLVDTFPMAISTPDASNPRIDSIVVYVDKSVTLPGGTPTSANLDGPGVAKAMVVAGTPNANPQPPSAAMIQTAIGSATYPYTVVENITVDPNVSVIAPNKIADVRIIATPKLAPGIATDANGYTVIDLGRIKLFSKSFTFEAGSIGGGVNVAVGVIDHPVGETGASYNNQRTVRVDSQSPFFNQVWESNTLYLRNLTGNPIDPGSIRVFVLGMKVS